MWKYTFAYFDFGKLFTYYFITISIWSEFKHKEPQILSFLDGQTPFHLAAEIGHIGIIKFLFSSGAKWSEKDVDNKTPYMIAQERGFKHILDYMEDYEKFEFWKTTKPKKLASSIHEAAYKGDLPSLIYHLYNGSKVDQLDMENGKWHVRKLAPLHYASINNQIEIVQYLLKNKAMINIKDPVSQTPLHFAAEKGNLETVLLLCSNNADVNAIDGGYSTPLHKAAMNGHIAVFECLLTLGANSSKPNHNGFV